MSSRKTIVVAGAGGFIGGYLTAELLREGYSVRAIDIKPLNEWHQVHADAENCQRDLSKRAACFEMLSGSDSVFDLAADMGGMGFIEIHRAECMLSVLINTHLLMAARHHGVSRYFYSSSACVYSADKQRSPEVLPLKEEDAYPAAPEDGYGWEKLFSERMCRHFHEDFGMETRVARYHNVYGPKGTYDGGREKAPAALCRKVIEAKLLGRGEIEIWGDGEQTRSFMYIDDCIKGTRLLMDSDCSEPINVGSNQLVSINEMLATIETIAGIKLQRRYKLDAPQGVRGRNSDNARIRQLFAWEPDTSLEAGLERTYRWIYDEILQSGHQVRRSKPASVSHEVPVPVAEPAFHDVA